MSMPETLAWRSGLLATASQTQALLQHTLTDDLAVYAAACTGRWHYGCGMCV
jgi:hypothetical protein